MFARTPRRTRMRSLGTPRLISDDEMDRIVEKFKTYGHQIKEQK